MRKKNIYRQTLLNIAVLDIFKKDPEIMRGMTTGLLLYGVVWQVDNKYFFVPDNGWWLGTKEKTMHTFDREKLIKKALVMHPDSDHFLINEDRTAFEPDKTHKEWSVKELFE